MIPTELLQPLSSVSFERQTQFAASQDLSFARSKYFRLRKTDRECDVQSNRPPDFSVKLYSSLSASEIRERKKNIKIVAPQPKEMKRRYRTFLPNSLSSSPKRKEPPKFIASHKPPDALETELMFVKIGKYHSGTYKNPKPHNFRPLDEELPDMIIAHERDPGNLKLKLKHLDTLRIRSETDFSFRDTNTRMDTYKPAEPKWDAQLFLPPLPWPPKSASYTRHKRRREAYSAFLDRVEEKLGRTWKNKL
ncbi:putative uncharacterized protein C7orf78 homolog [Oreochromis niloticus]|uniref:putative uncharacterized protein C7orf78 homolog n=1 Tax=Oreochromis niloticus TaxID=8128 RepID=UPI0003945363|nr:uncharacterized protein LOC102082416 [Oreochromis niloticus]CAI5661853.1 unnamed protein product [Mustela putorius furo]